MSHNWIVILVSKIPTGTQSTSQVSLHQEPVERCEKLFFLADVWRKSDKHFGQRPRRKKKGKVFDTNFIYNVNDQLTYEWSKVDTKHDYREKLIIFSYCYQSISIISVQFPLSLKAKSKPNKHKPFDKIVSILGSSNSWTSNI